MAPALRLAPIVIGGSLGLLVGLGLCARAYSLQREAPPCPAGWSAGQALAVAGARPLVGCRSGGGTRASGTGSAPTFSPRPAVIGLYRVDSPAGGTLDRWIDAAFHGNFGPNELAPSTTPAQESTEDEPGIAPGVVGHGRTREFAAELPLRAQVYFLSAGRRFGLLSIVHTLDEPFAEAANTARWMETIRGTAPWGAPTPGEMQASCPAGFADPGGARTARTVIRCMKGAGTSRFATLSLTWDEGGFGSDEDRTRVATAIAERVAHAQGAQARVEVPPEPFTLARNVDAIRTQVATGESVRATVRVIAAASVEGTRDVLALGVGEPDAPVNAGLASLLTSSGALSKPKKLSRPSDAGLVAVLLLVFGALAGLALSSRRPRAPTE